MAIIVKKIEGKWQRWQGEAHVNARRVADLVERGVWTDDDLAPHGLRAAEPFVVPEGKVIVGPERFEDEGRQQVFDVEDAPVPAAEVPFSISPLQARKALRTAGIKEQVDGFVATLPEEQQEEWEYATEIRRDHPLIIAGAAALGLTDEQINDLFAMGATL